MWPLTSLDLCLYCEDTINSVPGHGHSNEDPIRPNVCCLMKVIYYSKVLIQEADHIGRKDCFKVLCTSKIFASNNGAPITTKLIQESIIKVVSILDGLAHQVH